MCLRWFLQISIKKKSQFGLENTKHSMCPGYFFVIVKLFIESLSNLCMNHKYFLEITLYPLCVRTCFCKKVILYHRWWTNMSLCPKCQTPLIWNWSSTQVSTTCSPIFSRSHQVGLKVEVLLSSQVCHSTANVGSPGVGINMVRRLLRDTLAI